MKFFNKIKGLKLVALLAAMTACMAASAENKVYIEPFTISDYEPVEVPVYMDNDVDIMGVQFRVDLPAALEIVGEPAMNADRCSNGQELSYKGVGFIISSWEGEPISGNSGAILTFKVRVKEGMLKSTKVDFGMSRMILSDKANKAINLPDEKTVVTLVGDELKCVLSTAAPEVVVTPGATFPVAVSVANNVPMGGMQFLVTLPEGCTIKASDIKLSDRLVPTSRMRITKRPDGTLAFVLVSTSTTRIVEAGEGTLFTLNVAVPESYEAAEGTLKIFDVIASTIPDEAGMTEEIYGNDLSIKMVNSANVLADAQAVIAGLRDDLADALATIAEECPDVKDNFTGADITAAIDAIEAAVNEANANGTLAGAYDATVTDPAAAVSASIAKLIEDAKAAQAELEAGRVAANEAAYKASLAEIDALQTKLDNMKTAVSVAYPSVDVTAEITAAQDAIDKARVDAAAALEAVAEEGNYAFTVDTEAIEALIDAIRVEAQRVAANEAAYKASVAEIDALQAKLDNMKTTVGVAYPGVDVTTEITAAQDAIDKAKTEAGAALEAVAEEGNFDYTVDKKSIENLIDAILAAAKALGINDIEMDATDGVKYFNLQGVRISTPEKGVMLIRVTPDGKAQKVIL